MQIEINNKLVDVSIVRKNNKNIYVRVRDGKIVVSCNYLTSKNSIIKLINDNMNSIIKMMDRDTEKIEREECFYFFGKKYDLIYGFKDIEIDDTKIYAYDKRAIDKYINKRVIEIYTERINYWYDVFLEDIPKPNLKIRKMTSRWGVCNIRNHNVTLNYNLCKYDISCLDYVIVHELSHFIHPNHSKEFWNLVYKYCPKYKECRKMLKE